MHFVSYLLCSYNRVIHDKVCIDCFHYDRYADESAFEKIIQDGKSYVCCFAFEMEKRTSKTSEQEPVTLAAGSKSNVPRKRTRYVKHLRIPVMLGSYIDYRIRGRKAVEKSRAQWGAFILRGMLKIFPSFSTFDALSMHVREQRGKRSIEWFTYVNGKGLASKYQDDNLTWTYDRETRTCANIEHYYEWSDLLHQANPRHDEADFGRVTYEEYRDMFDTILSYPYDMNDLKNRQIKQCVVIMNQFIVSHLKREQKAKTGSQLKFSEAFESSKMYAVLSKKNAYETPEWCKAYPQNYESALHDGRSNIVEHLLSNANRASNETLRNSNAFSFPSDAIYYYCPINTKDLKAAGEQHTLTDFTIMTEESDVYETLEYLKTVSTGNRDHNKLILNGFIVNCFKDWSFEDLLDIKRTLPHVTTKYYYPYVLISTRDSIVIKYNDVHDTYFSPAETTEFKDRIRFKEDALVSTLVKQLDPFGIRRTQPAKSTVATNNLKGSVANLTSERLHLTLMRMTQGTTCYVDSSTSKQVDRILDAAVLSLGNDTRNFDEYFERSMESLGLLLSPKDRRRVIEPVQLEKTNVESAMSSLLKIYDPNILLLENWTRLSQKPSPTVLGLARKIPTTYRRLRVSESRPLVEAYLKMILGPKNYPAAKVWNMKCWAAFGNLHGACVEDGIILDEKMVRVAPPIIYNACITVDFKFKSCKHVPSTVFVPVKDLVSDVTESLFGDNRDTFVGCLISETEAQVKNSRHCEVMLARLGNHFYYLIHFLMKRDNIYGDLSVRCLRNGKTVTVLISGSRETRIGVGSKLANSFGQKNVCSLVTDLSGFSGVTRDGRRVHAQIVYSEVSLLGRLASGQLHNMLASPDLAIGPNGEFIAPIDLVVHALNPYTNMKIFNVKVDTMTNVNGFDSQSLCATSFALRNERLLDRVFQVLSMHGFHARILADDETRILKKFIP